MAVLAQAPLPAPTEPASMIIGMRTGDAHLTPSGVEMGGASRFLEIALASMSVRYRGLDRTAPAGAANASQYQAALAARLKLDGAGRFGIHAATYTGSGFSGGWNGISGPSRSQGLFVKQLYFEAKPFAGVSVQYGGLDIAHGESTEITSYDFDGYVTGERVRYQRSHPLLDSLTFTAAYLGDLDAPSVFDRFRRLGELNYGQVLWTKSIRRARVSAEYASASGERTWRQAVRFSLPKRWPMDTLQFENYQRTGADPGYGLGVYAERRLRSRVTVGVGYAGIDRSGLNSDRFPRGKRVYGTVHVPVGKELAMVGFLSRSLGGEEAGSLRTRFDLALSYDFLTRFRGGEPASARR